MARKRTGPRVPCAAWRALAMLVCSVDTLGARGDCVCRFMPRMRRAADRLYAALDNVRDAIERDDAKQLHGSSVSRAVHSAVIDAHTQAERLTESVAAVAERERGARATVDDARADLIAAMGKVSRAAARFRRALAKLDKAEG